MIPWIRDAVIYHLFPLGALDAPPTNDLSAAPATRLSALNDWLEPAAAIGANTILLGPIFESHAHGYDTIDYFNVDRRLGTNEAFAAWSALAHQRGFRVILDGVFNHVGRDFWAFRDVLANGASSRFASWFFLDFERPGAYETPFWYEGWNGFNDLVKLNVHHPEVQSHLFHAIRIWVEQFGIDGLRLDAADSLDLGFQQALVAYCHGLRADFWVMGEVIHGDYRRWVNPTTLDSVTNYEVYKGLYSSHNDRNYFEIAYSLNRQFGPEGIYRDLFLTSFVDNHDVDRVASQLNDRAHLFPLYALLFMIPGVPSIYYGSEWALEGRKGQGTDAPLRPALAPAQMAQLSTLPELATAIRRFAQVRAVRAALREGDYRQVMVDHEQFAFMRMTPTEQIVVMVNATHDRVERRLTLSDFGGGRLVDLLNAGESFAIDHDDSVNVSIDPCWARICLVER